MSLRRPGLSTRLGWVSFFNDASGEAITRLLPLYLATLGGPGLVGLVEGTAEGVAVALKAISGWWSDHLQSRKPLVSSGYALSAVAKVLMLLVGSPALLGSARVLDRTGKGLRGAPRDAMVADAAKLGELGRDFGITRLLDTLGAVAGLLLALALGFGVARVDASLFRRAVLWALPAAAVSVLLVFAWIPRIPRQGGPRRLEFSLPSEIRTYLGLVLLFTMAASSDAFLLLRGQELGFTLRGLLLLLVPFNLLAALLAVPAGRLSDRLGRLPFLLAGWTVYAACYAAMGWGRSRGVFAAAFLAYGAFYGLTEGVEKALLGDLLKPEHRGSGYGAFQLAVGLGTLVASLLMGWMWSRWGSAAAFGVTAGIALLSALLLAAWASVRSPA
ncbi:MAG TPA: MFS transporter [Holophagaceae bacterium]|nr:MFS transporter [Holophagaceae bacterium]